MFRYVSLCKNSLSNLHSVADINTGSVYASGVMPKTHALMYSPWDLLMCVFNYPHYIAIFILFAFILPLLSSTGFRYLINNTQAPQNTGELIVNTINATLIAWLDQYGNSSYPSSFSSGSGGDDPRFPRNGSFDSSLDRLFYLLRLLLQLLINMLNSFRTIHNLLGNLINIVNNNRRDRQHRASSFQNATRIINTIIDASNSIGTLTIQAIQLIGNLSEEIRLFPINRVYSFGFLFLPFHVKGLPFTLHDFIAAIGDYVNGINDILRFPIMPRQRQDHNDRIGHVSNSINNINTLLDFFIALLNAFIN